MQRRTAFAIVLVALGLAGCGSTDTLEWMKVDQRYTKEDFKRDYKECSRRGDLDDTCMRQRGWVGVNPSKSEAVPPESSMSRGRSRY